MGSPLPGQSATRHHDPESAKAPWQGLLLLLLTARLAHQSRITTTPVKVSRTQGLIAGDMADMAFVVTADVPLHIAQNGREHVLDAGDAIFLRGNERSVIQSRDRARFTNISVPIDDLTPMLSNCQDLSMTVVSRQSAALDLLLGYVRLLQTRQQPLSDELGHVAAAHARDMMAAMLESKRNADLPACERGGMRAARLRAIKADIRRHFCESGLSIDTIA